MVAITNYGKQSGTAECPPEDFYTVELVSFDNWEEGTAYNDPTKTVLQLPLYFSIVGFPEDFEDEDREYWSEQKIKTWANQVKDLNNEKATLGLMIKALTGRNATDVIPIGENIEMNELLGSKMKVKIEAKASGWPKLSAFAPVKKKSARPTARAAAPVPQPVAPEDDGWSEDDE